MEANNSNCSVSSSPSQSASRASTPDTQSLTCALYLMATKHPALHSANGWCEDPMTPQVPDSAECTATRCVDLACRGSEHYGTNCENSLWVCRARENTVLQEPFFMKWCFFLRRHFRPRHVPHGWEGTVFSDRSAENYLSTEGDTEA